MNIHLVRHGEADYSLEKKTGEFPGVPLTDKGRKQAQLLADKLKNINFDLVFCSDMLRAQQTIKPLLSYLPNAPIYESKLREVSAIVNGENAENWLEESTDSQIRRLDSFVNELKVQKANNILIICHFDVIKFISEKLGNKIDSPECCSHYVLKT